jgi:hypothetical protein
VEVADGDAFLDFVTADDVGEVALVVAVGDDDELETVGPVIGDGAVEDFCEELRAFLDWVETAGPEEEGGVRVYVEAETFLESGFGGAFAFGERVGVVFEREADVLGWGVASVRGVEDADGATCGAFVPDFLTDGWRDEVVLTVCDLVEEGRADGIDVVGGEDA